MTMFGNGNPSIDAGEGLAPVAQIEGVEFVPVDNEIAVKSIALSGDFHEDRADRFVVTSARKLAAPLVTADEKLLAYPHGRTIR